MTLTYYTDGKRHLVCKPYSAENLHQMAIDLGIKKCWFHSGTAPHYDIPKKRVEEIESKSILISSIELLEIIRGTRVVPFKIGTRTIGKPMKLEETNEI